MAVIVSVDTHTHTGSCTARMLIFFVMHVLCDHKKSWNFFTAGARPTVHVTSRL